MAADKLRKASSTGVASVATVSATRVPGVTSLSVGAGGLTNWATTTSVDFTTYSLVNGVVTGKADWTGRADIDNDIITDLELINGTDAGNEKDDIVVCIETSAWINDLITVLLGIFTVAGALKPNIITTAAILDSAITTAKMADSNVTTAKMADLNVTIAKLALDARKQSLDIDGSTEVVFSTAATQPAAQAGKTIIWFAPA